MSDLIAREVRLTVEAGKSVYVSMGGYAASGGYYISAPASRIYAEEGTITGSIGVTGLRPDASGLLNKLAIGSASVDAGDNANFGNMLLPRREDDADVLADYIRHIYERFIAVVAQGRSMDRSRVDELGQGQVWLGSEAVVNGLIDEIGGLQAAKAGMRKEFGRPVQFVDLLPGQAPVGFMVNRGNSNSLFKSVIGSPRIIVPGTEVLTFLDKNQAGVKGPAMPLVIKQTLELAAELEELGSGPQTLFTEYLFRDRVRH